MKTKEEVKNLFNLEVCICDSTLVDGERAAGVVFSNVEKYRIAQLLDNAGVPQIIAGIPALGGDDKVAVKHIAKMGLKASVMAYCKATPTDINRSLDCDVDSVVLSIPTSDMILSKRFKKDRSWVLEQIVEAVTIAKDHGLYIVCEAEDAKRTDLMFLIEFAKAIKEAGANRLCYYDSLGIDDPFNVYDKVGAIEKIVGIDVDIHARNDYGMATAVSVGAIKGGAKFVTTTVLGIGERTGGTALEQVVLSCKNQLRKNTGINISKLKQLTEFVSLASGYPVDPFKPIFGSNCFTYESGMHTSINADELNDEPFKPDEWGITRRMVIGKNSGTKSIITELAKKGIEIKREDAEAFLIMVRKATMALHRGITTDELEFLYNQYVGNCDVFDEKMIQ